ncbi:hypothetical protein B6A10_16175, partial [Flavobacterium sp. L1I52]
TNHFNQTINAMRKNYYIFVLTFLCMLCGQLGYAFDGYHGESEVINEVLERGFANDTDSTWFFDDEGNAFASLDSGNVSGDLITNDGNYHDYDDEADYIIYLVGGLSDEQLNDWANLEEVTAYYNQNGDMIYESTFLADVIRNQLHYLIDHNTSPTQVQIIDSTIDAVNRYYYGDGSAVELGPDTKHELLNDPDFIRVSNALINGTANRITADFAIHMTTDIFHVGDSNVDYETTCSGGICTTTFTAFVGDGFREPLDIDGLEVPYPYLTPDGQVNALEPHPYDYIPWTFEITYQNPGYPEN